MNLCSCRLPRNGFLMSGWFASQKLDSRGAGGIVPDMRVRNLSKLSGGFDIDPITFRPLAFARNLQRLIAR